MKADSWILNDLPERLAGDWYDLLIFTEYDLQVAAYYWMRRYFDRHRSERWSVRSQPSLHVRSDKRVKPDIVIYKNTLPYDVIELKCHLDQVREGLLGADVEKLRVLKADYSIRHAYQLVLYDDDGVWDIHRVTKNRG